MEKYLAHVETASFKSKFLCSLDISFSLRVQVKNYENEDADKPEP
jgi:hypothetical protein